MDTKESKQPKHLLADTPEEAEVVFNKYKNFLNGIAYTYSVSTGIDKADLFGEAVLGLSKAISNFDPYRGCSLQTYASRVIKSVLNDYVRRNTYTIFVPPYIKRANRLIRMLKGLASNSELTNSAINEVVSTGNFLLLPKEFHNEGQKLVNLIDREAKRASINYKALVGRAEYIPSDVELSDKVIEEHQAFVEQEEDLDSAMFVSHLKSYMSPVELSIANGIMTGKTYEEVANEHGKTKAWVKQKLNKFRDRIMKRSGGINGSKS